MDEKYTIQEAAEYLGVSQPTIFRWMKDGSLSYFKIGNATRFTKEGLDAVIEKRTGAREANIASNRCAVCGHGVLIPGRLQGTGRIHFHPAKTKFWTLLDSAVSTEARVCAACGYVQLHADVEKLSGLRPDDDEEGD